MVDGGVWIEVMVKRRNMREKGLKRIQISDVFKSQENGNGG